MGVQNDRKTQSLYGSGSRRVTHLDLLKAKHDSQRWPMLTAYDALTAKVFDDTGVPVLLVGDSAANVVYGYDTTVQVTIEQLLPLVQAVVRGSSRAMVVADMPFGSYQSSREQALETATRFLKEGGAHAVKLEGGAAVAAQVEAIVQAGIPVMGHLGLTPQSVHALGGYRVQGRAEAADRVAADAKALEAAGAFALVLEVIPAELAARITANSRIPTIGIGAGASCDAQVLVWQDLAGLTAEPGPKFVKRYANFRTTLTAAVDQFAAEVADGIYPAPEHSYK
ncbi:3-methyl-2-oxobutanoate hydroxymethyltransferase [Streptomyces sp. TX20-6-3]|uniref:3-methyl-2-oxobutanoate hydroxymethyltransferase n=1 Tax=Streptomyces sp. TX20-6-3 TaxID=3028705 RepID=UPI0029BF173B|nr:3-methyl-2-oxobutanoate hydroxymethyltransferase [Streptomyces sp. TX20-6-3]MDX2565436.1 3-methyl-2-oxobutanoate hydroxymethyltransferase [Streptomyces sp. TX20-6-3]